MPDSLTTREIECVHLAGQGLEDKEIAARLGISPRTVGNHLHRAYAKLGVSDRKLAARPTEYRLLRGVDTHFRTGRCRAS